MKVRPFTTGLSICLMIIAGIPCSIWADTDGPGSPNRACPESSYAEHGPCSDPHNFTSNGAGNGICGQCGNETWTYQGGACQGVDSGTPNCASYMVNQ